MPIARGTRLAPSSTTVSVGSSVNISGIDTKRSGDVVTMLRPSSILTISDDETFAERGGMANFFVEHDDMGIAVDVDAIQRAKLQVSSKLLALARIVRR